MGEIYIIKNYIFPELFYIGKAKNGAAKRWDGSTSSHVQSAINHSDNSMIHNYMRIYGIENFYFEILESNVPDEELNNKEKEYIKKYNTKYPNGFNLTDGGDGGFSWGEGERFIQASNNFRKSILKEKYIEVSKESLEKDIENKLTLEQICQKYHASPIFIRKRVQYYFNKTLCELRTATNTGKFQEKIIDKNQFFKDIKECKLSNQEIYTKYNIKETTFYNKCQEFFNLTPTQIRKGVILNQGAPKIDINRDELLKLIQERKTLKEIASHFETSEATIKRRIKEFFNKTIKEVRKEYD